MSGYKGDFTTANTMIVLFSTFDSNDPSASVITSDFVLGDIRIYKDGSVTQRSSTSGIVLLDTDGINFDALVGVHGFSVDLSDNDDAGFYAAGSEYNITVGPITVDGAVITFEAASFSVERVGGAIALLKGTNSLADIETKIDAVKTETALIVGDTNELQVDNVPGLIAALPTAVEIQAEMEANGASLLDTIRDELANATDGLSALKTLIDAIPTTMVGTDNAFLASVGGALADAAAAGEVTTADTLVQYIKQLINILIGNPGVVTFKAEAAPANGVSLSEVIRAIHVDTSTGVAVADGGITSVTFGAGAIDAAALSTDAGAELADAHLNRNMATGTDSGSSTVRTPRDALRSLRNRVDLSENTLTVFEEDDVTEAWRASLTTTGDSNFPTAMDPSG